MKGPFPGFPHRGSVGSWAQTASIRCRLLASLDQRPRSPARRQVWGWVQALVEIHEGRVELQDVRIGRVQKLSGVKCCLRLPAWNLPFNQ